MLSRAQLCLPANFCLFLQCHLQHAALLKPDKVPSMSQPVFLKEIPAGLSSLLFDS